MQGIPKISIVSGLFYYYEQVDFLALIQAVKS
jgi:hypothetical protein